MTVILSTIMGIVISLSIWFVNNYNAILAYGRKELGLFPMMYLNNSFDNWFLMGAVIGAIFGLSQTVKNKKDTAE